MLLTQLLLRVVLKRPSYRLLKRLKMLKMLQILRLLNMLRLLGLLRMLLRVLGVLWLIDPLMLASGIPALHDGCDWPEQSVLGKKST